MWPMMINTISPFVETFLKAEVPAVLLTSKNFSMNVTGTFLIMSNHGKIFFFFFCL